MLLVHRPLLSSTVLIFLLSLKKKLSILIITPPLAVREKLERAFKSLLRYIQQLFSAYHIYFILALISNAILHLRRITKLLVCSIYSQLIIKALLLFQTLGTSPLGLGPPTKPHTLEAQLLVGQYFKQGDPNLQSIRAAGNSPEQHNQGLIYFLFSSAKRQNRRPFLFPSFTQPIVFASHPTLHLSLLPKKCPLCSIHSTAYILLYCPSLLRRIIPLVFTLDSPFWTQTEKPRAATRRLEPGYPGEPIPGHSPSVQATSLPGPGRKGEGVCEQLWESESQELQRAQAQAPQPSLDRGLTGSSTQPAHTCRIRWSTVPSSLRRRWKTPWCSPNKAWSPSPP